MKLKDGMVLGHVDGEDFAIATGKAMTQTQLGRMCVKCWIPCGLPGCWTEYADDHRRPFAG